MIKFKMFLKTFKAHFSEAGETKEVPKRGRRARGPSEAHAHIAWRAGDMRRAASPVPADEGNTKRMPAHALSVHACPEFSAAS